ncbi:hypothetical protein L1987_83397 [Smallanthus sonchifolius]|uniref:Uncharacterized protein n=1 Tax=Smallanthus sonchifolius TaxID=185202 RepID=A0ACB8YB97_9ASTR|nr:hypothetical protein L1987_83397 [Smallanthus sonchifolius]
MVLDFRWTFTLITIYFGDAVSITTKLVVTEARNKLHELKSPICPMLQYTFGPNPMDHVHPHQVVGFLGLCVPDHVLGKNPKKKKKMEHMFRNSNIV